MEDLIVFLEMHSLTGAYALAFAANGVEDLAQLLAMPADALNELIIKCDIEAMDEIILRDALRVKTEETCTQRHMVPELAATKPSKTIDLSSPTARRKALRDLRDLEARYMVHAAEASAAERISLFKLGDDPSSPSNFDPANPNLFGPGLLGGA